MLLNLPDDIQQRVCALLDLRTILRLRRCSNASLHLVTIALRQKLYSVVEPFLVKPDDFLRTLESHDAFLGGDAALSFHLREREVAVDALELYVSDQHWKYIVYHLTFTQHAYEVPCPITHNVTPVWAPMHALDSVITMRTPKGDIYLYRAYPGTDTLTPIARAWCSLHICYVNTRHFGTGYPSLLFSYRALLSDGEDSDDTYACDLYLRRGFDIRLSADYWLDMAEPPYTCHSTSWACPAQARTFTDAGSMACRLRPLVGDPLRSSSVWRLDNRPCGGTCLTDGVGMLQSWQLFDSV